MIHGVAAASTRGVFISFEGGEGCGKSTQVSRLAEWFKTRGHAAETLREPGGTPVGEHIRHLLQFTPEAHAIFPEAELLLFAASRAQLVRERIEPLLAAGTAVISDRFLDSTTVYQGAGRKLPPEAVEAINRFAVGATRPDITFVLDLPVDVARARLLRRARPVGVADRMESLPLDFYESVRRGYLQLAGREPDRFCTIDASSEPATVFEAILKALNTRFPNRFS